MSGEIKKYLLFAGAVYYPVGGTKELRATADTVVELVTFFQKYAKERDGHYCWAEIVRHSDMKALWECHYDEEEFDWLELPEDKSEVTFVDYGEGEIEHCKGMNRPGWRML